MFLDYRIPPYQVLIGDFDVTDFVDEISLSLPIAEMGTMLIWSGRFTISRNIKAEQLGLSEDEFDSWDRPNRWRPAKALVRLRLYGYDFPALRIERYAYNRQARTGEGTLTQLLGSVATDRPAEVQVGGAISSGGNSPPFTSISSLVNRLIGEAFRGCSVLPSAINIGAQFGNYYGLLSSRNPASDAQRLIGGQWQWLNVNAAEEIRSVSGSVTEKPVIFTRSLQEIEYQPSIDHIDFAAYEVVVTGAYQKVATIPCATNPQPLNTALDAKGRPKYTKVQEDQPYKRVYTKPANNTLSSTLAEIKWIFYQYADDQNVNFQAAAFLPTALLFDAQSDRPLPNQPIDSPYQTITVYEQPAGRVFPSQGAAGNLIVAKIEIQSERRKGSWVPAGIIDPVGQPSNANLIVERYEIVKTKPVIAGNEEHGGIINPQTNKPACLTPAPIKEERQPLPEFSLETVPVSGRAVVRPIGWEPIYKRKLIVDVGFCPSAGLATYLAQQIADREWRRRDSVKVTMPLPIEWLAAGCPPLPKVFLGDGNFEADGLILAMSGQSEKCEFGFMAARIDRNGQSITESLSELTGAFIIEAEVTIGNEAIVIGEFIIEATVSLTSSSLITSAFVTDAEVTLSVISALPSEAILSEFIIEANVSLSAPLVVDPLWSSVLVSLPLNSASGLSDVKNNLTVANVGTAASSLILDPSGNNSGTRSFNGSEFINFASNQALSLPGDFAIEWFMYLTAYTAPQALWGIMDTRSGLFPQTFQLYGYSDGRVGLYDPGSAESTVSVLPLNQWLYCNLNRQGGTVRLHVGGSEVINLVNNSVYTLNTNSRLGAILNTGFGGVTGHITALRITNAHRSGVVIPTVPYPTA